MSLRRTSLQRRKDRGKFRVGRGVAACNPVLIALDSSTWRGAVLWQLVSAHDDSKSRMSRAYLPGVAAQPVLTLPLLNVVMRSPPVMPSSVRSDPYGTNTHLTIMPHFRASKPFTTVCRRCWSPSPVTARPRRSTWCWCSEIAAPAERRLPRRYNRAARATHPWLDRCHCG